MLERRRLAVAMALVLTACVPSAAIDGDGSVVGGDDDAGPAAVDSAVDRPDGAFESCAEATIAASRSSEVKARAPHHVNPG